MKGLGFFLSLCFLDGAFASEALFQAIDDHRERAALELLSGGKALLAARADPRARNRNGLTPSDYARRDGHHEVVRLLERSGK